MRSFRLDKSALLPSYWSKKVNKVALWSLLAIIIGNFAFYYFIGYGNGKALLAMGLTWVIYGIFGFIKKSVAVFGFGSNVYVYYGQEAKDTAILTFIVGIAFFSIWFYYAQFVRIFARK
jgi:hypothetical protein